MAAANLCQWDFAPIRFHNPHRYIYLLSSFYLLRKTEIQEPEPFRWPNRNSSAALAIICVKLWISQRMDYHRSQCAVKCPRSVHSERRAREIRVHKRSLWLLLSCPRQRLVSRGVFSCDTQHNGREPKLLRNREPDGRGMDPTLAALRHNAFGGKLRRKAWPTIFGMRWTFPFNERFHERWLFLPNLG